VKTLHCLAFAVCAVQAVAQFCLLAVVGMVLGIAFGTATSWLLDNIFRDPTLTTVVTLVSAYSSYYTADRLVGASGLLAVVCNGFTMSLIGEKRAASCTLHVLQQVMFSLVCASLLKAHGSCHGLADVLVGPCLF
jgi:NhaP-type Na+/H+ or K+/H+ antiporter